MKIKGFEIDERRFVKIIIISFIFVFMLSFSWQLSKLYFDIITVFSAVGIMSMPLFTLTGLIIYPLASFMHSLLPSGIGSIPLSLSTLYDFAALAGLLFFIFKYKKESKLNINDLWVLSFFILLNLLMIYHGVNISFSNYWYILSLEAILIYFVVSKSITNPPRIRAFCWSLILIVMSIIFRYTIYAREFQESFGGSFDNNMFSRDLVFIIPLVIYLFWSEKNKWLKGILLVCLALLIQNFAVMGSRASWISLIPVLLIISIKNIKKKSTWGFGVLAILFIIYYVISSPQIVNEIFSIKYAESGEYSEEGSIQGRFQALDAGLILFKEKPLLGWGPSRHEDVVSQKLEEMRMGGRNTHNAHLEVMLSMGLFGILIYIMLFVYSTINAYKAQKLAKGKDELIYNISWGVIFGLIALCINQAMINRSYTAIVWIGFGLSTALYHIAKNLPAKEIKDEKEMGLLQPEKELFKAWKKERGNKAKTKYVGQKKSNS